MSTPRTALVTGASRGIGRAIAVALGGEGLRVVINYAANRDAAEQVKHRVDQAGGEGLIVQGDIGDAAQRGRLVDCAMDAFGAIHVLVNNAGVAPNVRADLLDVTEDSYDRVMTTNLKGPFMLTQQVARRMIAQRDGGDTGEACVINIGSISAYTASINRGDYCIAKAGIGMMTRLFAARLAACGINVYEIRPGVIETDMTGPVKAKYDKLILQDNPGITPIRRWGQPDDVARAVVAIVRGQLPFSTGEVLNVDGGFHLKTL